MKVGEYMEFCEKLQELRKQKGLTQQQLAEALYVSRTAISKWEAGRGYPNIDSLKAIAQYFGITLDALLSTDEALQLAENANTESEARRRSLLYALLDVAALLLFFLPLFAMEADGEIRSVSLTSLSGVQPYMRVLYFTVVGATGLLGVLSLALQNYTVAFFEKHKLRLSLILGLSAVLLFTLGRQPYAAILALALLAFKAVMPVATAKKSDNGTKKRQ